MAAVIGGPASPYVAPFGTLIVLTAIAPHLEGPQLISYAVKTVIVVLVLAASVRRVDWGRGLYPVLGSAAGVGVLVAWVGLEGLYPMIGETSTVNPLASVSSQAEVTLVGFRLFGATVVVPLAEELFWRGFLIRWVIKPDFRSVNHGTFTWPSFLVTVGLFSIEHHRWLPGLIAGAAYNAVYYRTKSLKACVVAHAVTNLGLGVYVLTFGRWDFW